MNQIKHISLDAWNTLLSPNKLYAQSRTKFLMMTFGLSEECCKQKYTEIKAIADNLSREKGINFNEEELYKLLISAFNVSKKVDYLFLKENFEYLFLKNPPKILNETKDELYRLKENGYTINISSNTNFISGSILSEYVRQEADFFDFMIFSDLMWLENEKIKPSKPNKLFFQIVFDKTKQINDNITKNEILHIGDDYICDYIGAKDFGFNVSLLNKAEDLPFLLKGY